MRRRRYAKKKTNASVLFLLEISRCQASPARTERGFAIVELRAADDA